MCMCEGTVNMSFFEFPACLGLPRAPTTYFGILRVGQNAKLWCARLEVRTKLHASR